ncbi:MULTISPECIES: ParB N-terminal domain-containing protein [unclassified Dyella]|uniref:ParB N-terminal domain-containing protein n=1 Tax=Dyella sp. ASV21 TaxID=2795114 RepID=UPI0018EBE2A0|nr:MULTISPECIES: ParB N-terminal domain-containing protein [unclassified Dyella]
MSKAKDRRNGILGSVLASGLATSGSASTDVDRIDGHAVDGPDDHATEASEPPARTRGSFMSTMFGGQAQGLEQKLKEYEDRWGAAIPMRDDIDPKLVDHGPFHNRLGVAYDATRSEAFRSLKAKMAVTKGNTTPVMLREKDGGRYEAVYGYRRWQGCLQDGYLLRALILPKETTNEEVMVFQHFENEDREDISVIELGRQVESWMRDAGYGSADKVAARLEIGTQHLSELRLIGSLPDLLLEVHPDPLKISFRAARTLARLHRDREKDLIERLKLLQKKTPIPTAAEATAFLVALAEKKAPVPSNTARTASVKAEVSDGRISFVTNELSEDARKKFMKAVQAAAKQAGFEIQI